MQSSGEHRRSNGKRGKMEIFPAGVVRHTDFDCHDSHVRIASGLSDWSCSDELVLYDR